MVKLKINEHLIHYAYIHIENIAQNKLDYNSHFNSSGAVLF